MTRPASYKTQIIELYRSFPLMTAKDYMDRLGCSDRQVLRVARDCGLDIPFKRRGPKPQHEARPHATFDQLERRTMLTRMVQMQDRAFLDR